jgi:hypothetical protein
LKVYNIIFSSTYRTEAQVSWALALTVFETVAMTANGNYQGFCGRKAPWMRKLDDSTATLKVWRLASEVYLALTACRKRRLYIWPMQQLSSMPVSSQSLFSRLALAERSSKGIIAAKQSVGSIIADSRILSIDTSCMWLTVAPSKLQLSIPYLEKYISVVLGERSLLWSSRTQFCPTLLIPMNERRLLLMLLRKLSLGAFRRCERVG